ncbi:hypothetical protein MKW94_016651 [Papaver nudicaule]|uniref:LOB domain-containing protein n=1 Tax=Papaver nudicaule TaxID=74823 RepID=A0AA41S9V1_PAPNU|nr:hypothetical protein [Papaver nudicaule]
MSSVTGSGSPYGACKFLKRKCASDCIFAPYFCSEQGPALLYQVLVHDRCEAVVTIAYEAQARIRDPVYGCVAHIFALQQHVAYLQAQLMQMKSQLTYINTDQYPRCLENNWSSNIPGGSQNFAFNDPATNMYSVSPQSSLDSIDKENVMIHEIVNSKDDLFGNQNTCNKKRLSQNELNELQAVALRMMRNN